MELLIKSNYDILNEKLSLVERGILISILLCKDVDPRITLAKLKVHVKINSVKDELINLHEKGFIKWSGYKAAKKSKDNVLESSGARDIIDWMNALYDRKFKYTDSNLNPIIARIRENSIDDVKLVVANRYAEWKSDAVMSKHLNPTTIFRPSKFDKYLEEAKRTKSGESFVTAENINLNHGDVITSEIAKTFSDKDTYNIKIYQADESGNKRGNGSHAVRYGKDIKKMINIQDRLIKKEHIYIYIQK